MSPIEPEEAYALTVVNKLRAAAGAKPLDQLRPGIPGSAGKCTIAASLKETPVEYVDAQGDVVKLVGDGLCDEAGVRGEIEFQDAALADFIDAFDAGLYPELIA